MAGLKNQIMGLEKKKSHMHKIASTQLQTTQEEDPKKFQSIDYINSEGPSMQHLNRQQKTRNSKDSN